MRCDRTSVGLIVRCQDDFLVIKRNNFPVSYAFVAGHCDGDDPEHAARRELREEAGLRAITLTPMLSQRYVNPCRRDGTVYHELHVFDVLYWMGITKASSDAAEALWLPRGDVVRLIYRTIFFASRLNMRIDDPRFTYALALDEDWKEAPGLEPVWCQIFGRLMPQIMS